MGVIADRLNYGVFKFNRANYFSNQFYLLVLKYTTGKVLEQLMKESVLKQNKNVFLLIV